MRSNDANLRIVRDTGSTSADFYRRAPVPLSTSIDSLKIRIPVDYVTILCPELRDSSNLIVNDATGRIVGKHSTNKRSFTNGGIETPYTHEAMNVGSLPGYFVTVGLNSKILQDQYFDGLTTDTVGYAYDRIMEQGVIECTRAAFLSQAHCTDIDVKRDSLHQGGTAAFREQLKQLQASTRVTRKKGTGCRLFTKKGNIGIEWSDRRTTAFSTAPFLKMYHKGQELIYKPRSAEFARDHLHGFNYADIIRIEATIKNKQHYQSIFGAEAVPTLENVVNLTPQQLGKAIDRARAVHLDGEAIHTARRNMAAPVANLKGQDRMLYRLLQMAIEDGRTLAQVIDEAVNQMYQGAEQTARNSRSKYRKKIEHLAALIEQDAAGNYCPIFDLFFDAAEAV